MSWDKVVMTQVGEELMSKMLNGSKLIITRIAIGSTTVSDSQLPLQKSVSSPIPAPALIAGKEEIQNGTQLNIQIRNDGIAKATRMKQIGVFAKTDNSSEVMIGILQDGTGEEIPAYNDFPEFLLEFAIDLFISRTNNIQVVVSPSVYATCQELENLRAAQAADTDGIREEIADLEAYVGYTAAGNASLAERTAALEEFIKMIAKELTICDVLVDNGNKDAALTEQILDHNGVEIYGRVILAVK